MTFGKRKLKQELGRVFRQGQKDARRYDYHSKTTIEMQFSERQLKKLIALGQLVLQCQKIWKQRKEGKSNGRTSKGNSNGMRAKRIRPKSKHTIRTKKVRR